MSHNRIRSGWVVAALVTLAAGAAFSQESGKAAERLTVNFLSGVGERGRIGCQQKMSEYTAVYILVELRTRAEKAGDTARIDALDKVKTDTVHVTDIGECRCVDSVTEHDPKRPYEPQRPYGACKVDVSYWIAKDGAPPTSTEAPPKPTKEWVPMLTRSRSGASVDSPLPITPSRTLTPAARPAPPRFADAAPCVKGRPCATQMDAATPEHVKRAQAEYEAATAEARRKDAAELEAINLEQVRKQQAWQVEDDRRKAEYRAAVEARRVAMEKAEADTARERAAYERRMEEWRQRVKACEAGDRSQCGA